MNLGEKIGNLLCKLEIHGWVYDEYDEWRECERCGKEEYIDLRYKNGPRK